LAFTTGETPPKALFWSMVVSTLWLVVFTSIVMMGVSANAALSVMGSVFLISAIAVLIVCKVIAFSAWSEKRVFVEKPLMAFVNAAVELDIL